MTEMPPANWYPAPDEPGQLRFWDGSAWTEQRRPIGGSIDDDAKLRRPGRRLWIALSAVAALIIGVGVVSSTLARQNDEGSTGAADSQDSPHDICVRQLLAMTANMANNNAQTDEMLINGGSDPFWHAAIELSGRLVNNAYDMGSTRATEQAEQEADSVCTNTLDDEIRPNYPTDGTYP